MWMKTTSTWTPRILHPSHQLCLRPLLTTEASLRNLQELVSWRRNPLEGLGSLLGSPNCQNLWSLTTSLHPQFNVISETRLRCRLRAIWSPWMRTSKLHVIRRRCLCQNHPLRAFLLSEAQEETAQVQVDIDVTEVTAVWALLVVFLEISLQEATWLPLPMLALLKPTLP